MPASAPSGQLIPCIYDDNVARTDLEALDGLLAARVDLSERDSSAPSSARTYALPASMGSYNSADGPYGRRGACLLMVVETCMSNGVP